MRISEFGFQFIQREKEEEKSNGERGGWEGQGINGEVVQQSVTRR